MPLSSNGKPGVTHLTVGAAAAREARDMEILILCAVLFVGVVYGYYTVDGSGIAEHPYRDIYGGAPGAFAPASVSGRDETVSVSNWSRGTR
jgi:hypothetical protein